MRIHTRKQPDGKMHRKMVRRNFQDHFCCVPSPLWFVCSGLSQPSVSSNARNWLCKRPSPRDTWCVTAQLGMQRKGRARHESRWAMPCVYVCVCVSRDRRRWFYRPGFCSEMLVVHQDSSPLYYLLYSCALFVFNPEDMQKSPSLIIKIKGKKSHNNHSLKENTYFSF